MENIHIFPDMINPCKLVRETCQKVCDNLKSEQTPSVTIKIEELEQFIVKLREKVEKSGVAFEKWSKYHLDPTKYTLE